MFSYRASQNTCSICIPSLIASMSYCSSNNFWTHCIFTTFLSICEYQKSILRECKVSQIAPNFSAKYNRKGCFKSSLHNLNFKPKCASIRLLCESSIKSLFIRRGELSVFSKIPCKIRETLRVV